MKVTNVVLLYGTRLRARAGQELLAVLGIAVGVSLLFAALVANASLTGSFDRTLEGVVGDAQWQLTARGASVPESTTRVVQHVPGVAAAAPMLETRAELRGPNGRSSIMLIGVTAGFAKVNGRQTQRLSVRYLAGQRAIGLPAKLAVRLGLSLGDIVTLNVSGRLVKAPLGALLQRDQIGDLVNTPLALAPLSYAQALTGQARQITRIFVVPRAGEKDALQTRLRSVDPRRMDIHSARFEGAVFRQASEPTSQSTAMFSVFSALVGFLFAFSAVLLTVPDRRRLIAGLDREGYTPRTITLVMLFDALVLGVVGSALGIVIGDQVSRRLFAETPSFLELAFTFGAQRIVTFSSVATAALGGLAASCIAVLAPTATAIRGTRDHDRAPAGTRRLRRVDPSLTGGSICLAAGVAIVIASPRSAAVGIFGLVLLTAAMLLLLPTVLRLAVAALAGATRGLRSVVPFLASVDLRDRATRVRALAVAATGAVAVFGSVALQGAHADLQRGLDRTTSDQVSVGDLWAMIPGGANLLTTIAFEPPTRLPAVSGIASIGEFRGSFLDIGDRRVWVTGVPPDAPRPVPRHQTLEGAEQRVDARIRAGGWAVVSAGVAHELNLHVGERFTLPAPHPLQVRLAAISTNMGWPPGAILLNSDDYATAWGSRDATALTATLAPGASTADAQRALAAALGPGAGVVVKTAADRERALRHGSRQGLERLTQIAGLVLVAAMIAIAVAMAGLIWQRRRFYTAVKIEGYGTGELWRALLLESSLLIGIGCLLGAGFGLLGQGLLSRSLTNVTGFPVDYSLAAIPAVASCAAVIVVSVAIVSGFGYYTARIEDASVTRE